MGREALPAFLAGEGVEVAAMRGLKPGGIAVHTTEHKLDGSGGTIRRGPTVLYQRRHLDRLAGRLEAVGHVMLPIDAAGGAATAFDQFVDLPPYPLDPSFFGALEHVPHLQLAPAGHPVTSVGIVAKTGPTRP